MKKNKRDQFDDQFQRQAFNASRNARAFKFWNPFHKEPVRAPRGFKLYFDQNGRRHYPPVRPLIVPDWYLKQGGRIDD